MLGLNLFQITYRLCKLFYSNHHSDNIIKPYFSFIYKLVKTQGIIHSVKYLKQIRLHITKYICGQPLYINDLHIGIDNDGWPKRLLFMKHLAHGNIEQKKYLLTLLLITRSFQWTKDVQNNILPKYETITDKPKSNYIINSGFINKFVSHFNLKKNKPSFDKSKIYLSNKGGPNGPATLTSHYNLLNYNYDNLQLLYNLTDEEGQKFITDQYNFCWNKWYIPKNKYLGKLSFILDPEYKLRIIAIVDYYRQLFFKPIHEDIFDLLKLFPCDRTFTQNPRHQWKDNDHKFWSLDLSSATDRFPIGLQRRLIERIYSDNKFSQSWEKLLQNEFITPEGSTVKYNTGQPMGSYSSWAAFTICHHLVVHYCAQKVGYKQFSFNQYIILGDDIVIKDDNVAQEYIRIITKLGVELSLQKTHVSKDTYEFAKRWFHRGQEITHFPIKGIVDNINNPFIVLSIIYDHFKIKNNLYTYQGTLVNLIVSLYDGLQIKFINKKRNRRKITSRYLNINKRFKDQLDIFLVGLDRSFGFLTEEKLKIFFNKMTKDSLYYQGPSDMITGLSELDRIISDGLVSRTSENMVKISKSFDKVMNLSKDKFNIQSIDELRQLPIFTSITNYLKEIKESSKTIDFKTMGLNETVNFLSLIDIDKIFNKERNKILDLLNIGQLTIKGFKINNKIDEIYYGSATTESTFHQSDYFSRRISGYLDPIIKDFENKDPFKQEELKNPLDAWANLANFKDYFQ